ncbi:MAG: acetyl-CoA carboxylase biotin carboxylase subunit [Bacteroidetes bacterium]|nr:acetyl-CoA carboxylase biotin carboxylase subunit [Bacteroidota bacterium]
MKKILIANRGEIALRVMKTCRKMGIKTIAVFSESDRTSLHVKYADEAYLLGPSPSSQSYLAIDKVVEIAKNSGADGIHPGYGFLSENAAFAEKLENEGIKLIGPSPQSMKIMGDKLSAKEAVKKYNIPLVPGTESAVTDISNAKEECEKIGFPVLIKASAGGGGKGMRIVKNSDEFEEQMQLAVREAQSAFGDGSVFIEKFVTKPRHIEIQVLGDDYGNYVYLFERECSIQRRHQKLVEESPSPIITEEIRNKMGEAAVNVARSCNYSGAGTVEFLMDDKSNFYFLEMNTRLQVEHPVTEMITGIDLVEEQIKIARGEKLSFTQQDLKINGHSIELRICSEDPDDNFVPSIGKILKYSKPKLTNVRVDDCIEEGMEVSIYYDNMISKLIVWAKTRNEAIALMKQAIKNYKIEGISTTLSFGEFVMNNTDFIDGNFDTNFVENNFRKDKLIDSNEEIAAIFSAWYFELKKKNIILPNNKENKQWKENRKKY